jgi:ABC-type transport system involved in multi-copper enzyme maturation permease subunit
MEHESTMKKNKNSGLLCGFKNKVREENGRWWGTRKWLVQTVVWLLIINGISLIALIQLRNNPATFSLSSFVGVFMGLMGWMVAFGVIILTQSDIVEEKQSGTAEWVLSSPLSRESFILSKLFVNVAWLVAIIVILQGVVFNLVTTSLNVGTLSWLNLAQGLALQGLYLAFWLSLTIMLGTFFKSRSQVIGVPLILLFLQRAVPMIFGSSSNAVSLLLPERLPEYSTNLLLGNALPSFVPIVAVTMASMVFILLAILRFRREEFKGN